MGDRLKIVASEFDTFKFERAFIGEADGDPQPRAIISGVECNIDTKPGILDHGLAFCQPVDPSLEESWPVYTDVILNGVPDRWWNITDNPQVVEAAKRLAAEINSPAVA